MIKVIAFDLGGVLFAEGKSVLVNKLSTNTNYDSKLILNLLTSPPSIELRTGNLSDEEFWKWVQEQLPEGYDAHLIKREWYNSYLIDQDVFSLVKKLHGKYKLIAFSGNIKSRVEYLDEKYGFRKFFDAEVYSFDYHLSKPDKEFIKAMITKAGVKPEEIVYIDDDARCTAPACKMGVKTIIYVNGKIESLHHELQRLGVNF